MTHLSSKIVSIAFALITTLSVLIVPTSLAQENSSQFAKPFSIKTVSGDNFNLATFKHKKPVYLFFWATWCPICKRDVPRVKALSEKFANKIEILGVNVGINDSMKNLLAYQKKYELNYALAFDEGSELSTQYGVVGTPTHVIIDTQGVVRYQGHRFPPKLENVIDMLYVEN